jgi:hypothetical protein
MMSIKVSPYVSVTEEMEVCNYDSSNTNEYRSEGSSRRDTPCLRQHHKTARSLFFSIYSSSLLRIECMSQSFHHLPNSRAKFVARREIAPNLGQSYTAALSSALLHVSVNLNDRSIIESWWRELPVNPRDHLLLVGVYQILSPPERKQVHPAPHCRNVLI